MNKAAQALQEWIERWRVVTWGQVPQEEREKYARLRHETHCINNGVEPITPTPKRWLETGKNKHAVQRSLWLQKKRRNE